MASDRHFFYDFNTERKIENWKIIRRNGETLILEAEFENRKGEFVFLLPVCRKWEKPDSYSPRSLSVNGEEPLLYPKDAFRYYADQCDGFFRCGFDVSLREGNNRVTLTLRTRAEGFPKALRTSLVLREKAVGQVRSYRRTVAVKKRKITENRSAGFDPVGWTPGIGRHISPGRFGFSKGDGLPDCAMPALGIVNKMFLSGEPRYRKPYFWSCSLLPPGMPWHGSYEPMDTGIEKDRIEVNHLSVKWEAEFNGHHFRCTGSLASPAILCESDCGFQRLSDLRFAGNYRYILIPGKDGVTVCSLDDAELSGMSENWILLFGCSEYPDLPLMLAFDRKPQSFESKRHPDGRLSELIFGGCPLMFFASPFGIESFQPLSPEHSEWISDAADRCRFWSRAFLAFPTACTDYFKIDESSETVKIMQKFSYRYIPDEWGTAPLELAPLPPAATLCGTTELSGETDFHFPTKYGWLKGRTGNVSGYVLPFMPVGRKFPFPEEHSNIPEILKHGMKHFRAFTDSFPPTKEAYPYAGSLLEPFAFASTMSLYMEPDDREYFRTKAAERLSLALSENNPVEYPVVDFLHMMKTMPDCNNVRKLYESPEIKHRKLWNWYDRTEPFTGAKYKICYLNLCLFYSGDIKEATPEEISGLKIPLIENDWGVGMTFYYLYLCALAAGSFDEIRTHWKLIQSVYAFFDEMHDWACMGTGFSDDGMSWVEGANYGLFTSYINMAEAVGDAAARDFGIYNAAKQLALRLAILRSSAIYFPRYFEVEPWHCTKHFHEEASPCDAFQNVPEFPYSRMRRDAIYNITTEGLYPEAYTAMRRFAAPEYDAALRCTRNGLLAGKIPPGWVTVQQYSGILIDEALNPAFPPGTVLHDLAEGDKKGLLLKEWRGIHIFSRLLPEYYFRAQILAWLEMRGQKLWLEHWENIRIRQAQWKDGKAVLEFEGTGRMKIRCGVSSIPSKIRINGKETVFRTVRENRIELHPGTAGTLTVEF